LSADRLTRVRELYERALELAPAERAAFLAKACPDDTELRNQVLGMLAVEPSTSFLEPPAFLGRPPRPERLGDFEILSELGQGSSGTVYLARQTSLHREVAVKVLLYAHALAERLLEDFRKETQIVARFDHPGIVRIHCVGFDAGVHYFAMERIQGHSLSAELDALAGRGDGQVVPLLPAFGTPEYLPSVARLVAEAADALHYAHERNVVHRDVKPQNILLDHERRPHLVDFGLAMPMGANTSRPGAGTPLYMSPEQAMPAGGKLDHRSDIFSLGVVLYELLTLRHPFQAGGEEGEADVRQRIALHEPRRVRVLSPRVHADLEAICETALNKAPALRFQSAKDFADELRRFLGGEPLVLARRSTALRRAWRHVRRRSHWYLPSGAASVVLLAAVWFLVSVLAPPHEGHLLILGGAPELAGLRVYGQRIDLLTRELGEPELLGVLPLDDAVSIEADASRFTLVRELGASTPSIAGEFTRHVEAGRTLTLDLAPPVELTDVPMVLVPAGEYVVGEPGAPDLLQFPNRRLHLDAFWIDATEVTNLQYRRFVEATKRTPPGGWAAGYRAEWDLLPVTGVTFADATAFAEWAGKRLPTQFEWEAAARGPKGFRYPWGDDAANLGQRAVLDRPKRADLWAGYLESVRPAGSTPDDRSPFGCFDMLGNVFEWTESIPIGLTVDGEPVPDLGGRILKGVYWDWSVLLPPDLVSNQGCPVAAKDRTGFRCARSTRPRLPH